MHALRNATFATLFIGATIAASAHADNTLVTGCSGSIARTDSEGGGVGYQPAPGAGVRRTESEGGGVGYQPAPGAGVRRAEAEGGGAATTNMATHKTEAAADSVASADQPARPAASAPCK
jgi:hypothetical protein